MLFLIQKNTILVITLPFVIWFAFFKTNTQCLTRIAFISHRLQIKLYKVGFKPFCWSAEQGTTKLFTDSQKLTLAQKPQTHPRSIGIMSIYT